MRMFVNYGKETNKFVTVHSYLAPVTNPAHLKFACGEGAGFCSRKSVSPQSCSIVQDSGVNSKDSVTLLGLDNCISICYNDYKDSIGKPDLLRGRTE